MQQIVVQKGETLNLLTNVGFAMRVSRKEIVVSRGRGKGFWVYGLSNNCYGLGDLTMKGEVCPRRVYWAGFGNSGFKGMGNS